MTHRFTIGLEEEFQIVDPATGELRSHVSVPIRPLSGSPVDSWPRWEEMLGLGGAAGFIGAPRAKVAGAGAA